MTTDSLDLWPDGRLGENRKAGEGRIERVRPEITETAERQRDTLRLRSASRQTGEIAVARGLAEYERVRSELAELRIDHNDALLSGAPTDAEREARILELAERARALAERSNDVIVEQ